MILSYEYGVGHEFLFFDPTPVQPKEEANVYWSPWWEDHRYEYVFLIVDDFGNTVPGDPFRSEANNQVDRTFE